MVMSKEEWEGWAALPETQAFRAMLLQQPRKIMEQWFNGEFESEVVALHHQRSVQARQTAQIYAALAVMTYDDYMEAGDDQ